MAVVAVVGYVAFKLPAALPPGLGLLAIAGIASAVIYTLTRYNPEETAGPAARNVSLVTVAVVGGVGWTVQLACAALARGVDPVSRPIVVVLAVAAVAMITMVAWSRLRDAHPATLTVTVVDAVDAVTDSGRIRAALVAAIVVGAAGSLAYAGVTVAPAVAVLALLIPVGLGWRAAKTRGNTRVEFSAAFVGLMSGGAWTRPLEDAARSPIACRWDDDRTPPTRIVMPLPAKWASTGVEALEGEVSARLAEHGQYVVRVELGSKRRVTATLVPPMPTSVRYDGRPAEMGTKVWLGVGQAGRLHAAAPGSLGKANGDLLDVYWDLRTEPMGIAVGTPGSGKTQTVSLIMIQLALAGFKLILLDPKRVEFAAWEGRPGVLKVATTLPDMVDCLTSARAEMEIRFEEMRAGGVNHIDLLPVGSRPPRLLIVVDEVVELLGKEPGKSDEAKGANDLKDQAGIAIGSILQLGRAAGIHLLVAGQRVERSLFSGTWQNNIALKVLHGTADAIERQMIGLTDVQAASGIPGRAVMRSFALPQTEVQIAYVDLQKDLDRWLPVRAPEDADNDPLPPVVDLQPQDLVPLQPVNVVPTPTPPARVSKPATQGNTDGDDGPKFHFDVQQPMAPGKAQEALDNMIGLPGVKAKVRELVAQVEVDAKRRSLGVLGGNIVTCQNLVFVGAPGTGKTAVARILASRLAEISISAGVLVECDRSSLVAAYLGQTSKAVDQAFQAVHNGGGGVLFIDEAYSLMGDQFGQEAITAILKRAEDMGDVTVVLAGYPAEIDQLLNTNPGLRSRFAPTGRVTFEDYTDPELLEIYESMVSDKGRVLSEDAGAAVAEVIEAAERGRDWGNARSVRVMVDAACAHADVRLHSAGLDYVTHMDLQVLTAEDVRGPAPDADADADAFTDVVDADVIEGEIVDDEDVNADDTVDDAWIPDDLVERLTKP